MKEKRPQIILFVQGGIVEDVVADTDVDVFIVDADNIRDDAQAGIQEACVTVGVGRYKKFLAEQQRFVAAQAKEQGVTEDDGEPRNQELEEFA